MLSLLKLPLVIISYDFVVSGLAASPGAGLCCASEDSRAISNLLEIINKAACLVFLIGMIEQEVFDLLKVACLADVENHNLSRPSIKISSAVNRPFPTTNGYFRLAVITVTAFVHQFKNFHLLCPLSSMFATNLDFFALACLSIVTVMTNHDCSIFFRSGLDVTILRKLYNVRTVV